MGAERLEDVADRLSVAGMWQLDRRRFLQLAGAGGLVGIAGFTGSHASILAPHVRPALAAAAAGSPTPVLSSVADLARSLEYDVDAIFRFVADEIRYEPYAGVLRGATGTLWARAGNSADQAMLLSALLDQALVSHRFVSGPISDVTAGTLLAAAQLSATASRDEAVAVLTGGVAPSAPTTAASPSPDPNAQAFVEKAQATQAAFMSTASAQVQDGIDTISAALAAAGITLPSATPALPQRERSQHTWLQIASGADWLDLDASLPGAQQGQVSGQAGAPLDALPDDARHRIEFDLIAETVVSGVLQQDAIFHHAEFADDLVGVPAAFVMSKPEGLKGLGVALVGTLTGTVQYLPVLIVGDSSTGGKTPVSFSTGGGLGGAFGNPGTFEGETTAAWLQVSVISPDAPAAVAKRAIFDRVGDDVRAAGTFNVSNLSEVQLTDLDAATTAEYLPCLKVHAFSVQGGPLNAGFIAVPPPEDDLLGQVGRLTSFYHYMLAGLSGDIGIGHGVRAFNDAPTVVSYTIVPGAPAGADFSFDAALDIWHRSFGLATVTDTTPSANPGVVAGVMSHVAERLILGEGVPADPAALPTPVLTVGRIFDEARFQGIAIQVLRGPSAPVGLAFSPQAQLRIADRIAAGYAVIVPERAVNLDGGTHIGWWLVDPATGRTSDELEDGRGGIVEYFELNAALLTEALKIVLRRLFACVAKYAVFAAFLIDFSNVNGLPTSVGLAMNAVGIAASTISQYAAFACA